MVTFFERQCFATSSAIAVVVIVSLPDKGIAAAIGTNAAAMMPRLLYRSGLILRLDRDWHVRLEHLVEAPARRLAAGSQPNTACGFHVLDNCLQCTRAAGAS
jgi:hypothetical protein